MKRILLTTALLLGWPSSGHAQSVLETVWSDLLTTPGDLVHVWTAPARIDGDEVGQLLVFAATTGLLAAGDLEIQGLVRELDNTVLVDAFEPFRHEHDALSRLGQNHWVLRLAGAGYLVGLAIGQDWLRESSLGCAVGNISNALPRKAVYALVSRARPSTSPDDPYDIDVPGGEWGVHSFFGGHAANAFTCASFLAHRWDMGWGEPVVWVLASGVAVARMLDEAHWSSDTLVGSAFGFVAGRLIAERQLRRGREREDADDARSREAGTGASSPGIRLEGVGARPLSTYAGTVLLVEARIAF